MIAEYTSRLAHRSCVLATRKAVDLGSVFVFEMYCPDHETPVELEAEVVRARPIYGAALTYELAMQYRASRTGQAALEGLLRRIESEESLSAAQRAVVERLTGLQRPAQPLVSLAEPGRRAAPSGLQRARRAEIAGVVAAVARQELAVALGIGVLQGPQQVLDDESSCLACVGFTGQLTGELSLCASVNLCAAIASQIAGDTVTREDRAEILDGLREFVMALGGSFCDRMEMQGIEISLTEPLLGLLPTFSPGDQHHTVTMTGDRGSAVFRVMVREG